MSPSESGKSESIDEHVEKVSSKLDAFEMSVGLPVWVHPATETEAKRLLSLEPESLQKMSSIDCGEAAFILFQYAMTLQKAINREQAKLTLANASIGKIIGASLAQQKAYAFEERKLLAIRENEAASAWQHVQVNTQMRIDRIVYLSGKVDSMAKSLMALQQSKRGNRD